MSKSNLYKTAVAVIAILLSVSSLNAEPKKNCKDMNLPIREIMNKYYADGQFYFGASSMQKYWKNPDKLATQFFKEFSYNTPENSFKISTVFNGDGTGKDRYKSEEHQYFIEQARKHKQIIRAHGPVSPQTNNWSKEDNRTPEELDGLLTRFMTLLSIDLEKDKDVVKWMDVVNESFTGSNQTGIGYNKQETEDIIPYRTFDWFGPRKGVKKWENPWSAMGFDTVQINGQTLDVPKHIVKSFRIATDLAPSVKLIWNDHGKVINPKLYDKLKLSVQYLRSQGMRVDGIGWQAHVDMGWEKDTENIKNLENLIDWCYQNKLEFHITELDVTISQTPDAEKLIKTRNEQAATFAAMTETILKKVGKGAAGLNVWTMYDHNSATGTQFSGLFDKEGTPTPAYFKVKELLIKYGKMQK